MVLCCFAANQEYSMWKHQRGNGLAFAGALKSFFLPVPLIQVTLLPVVFDTVFTKSKEVFEVLVAFYNIYLTHVKFSAGFTERHFIATNSL